MLKPIICAALIATLPGFAQAAQNCAERARILERLDKTFGETRQSIGLAANNNVVETFASAETGSWTITMTTPQGMTCLIASGQAFESTVAEPTAVKGQPV